MFLQLIAPSVHCRFPEPINQLGWYSQHFYMIIIKCLLLIYTSMKHSLLSLKLLALVLNSLDTLSDIRIKAFTLLF